MRLAPNNTNNNCRVLRLGLYFTVVLLWWLGMFGTNNERETPPPAPQQQRRHTSPWRAVSTTTPVAPSGVTTRLSQLPPERRTTGPNRHHQRESVSKSMDTTNVVYPEVRRWEEGPSASTVQAPDTPPVVVILLPIPPTTTQSSSPLSTGVAAWAGGSADVPSLDQVAGDTKHVGWSAGTNDSLLRAPENRPTPVHATIRQQALVPLAAAGSLSSFTPIGLLCGITLVFGMVSTLTLVWTTAVTSSVWGSGSACRIQHNRFVGRHHYEHKYNGQSCFAPHLVAEDDDTSDLESNDDDSTGPVEYKTSFSDWTGDSLDKFDV